MKVWIVMREREWDWQVHEEIVGVYADENDAAHACSRDHKLNYEEWSVITHETGAEHG